MKITLYGCDFETDWRQRGVCAELGEDGSGVLDVKTSRKGEQAIFILLTSKLELLVLSSTCHFQVRPVSSKLMRQNGLTFAEGLPTTDIT